MKTTLYTFPFACSLAVDIVLRQHDVVFDTVAVDRGPGRKVAGALEEVNQKRKVPTLVLDGTVLTEIVAVLFRLDELVGQQRAPADRQRLLEWCAFIASELHQQVLAPVFDEPTPEAAREDALQRLMPPVLADIERGLVASPSGFLLGDQPSGADAYLYWAVLLIAFRDPGALGDATRAFRKRMEAFDFVRDAVAGHRAAMASGQGRRETSA